MLTELMVPGGVRLGLRVAGAENTPAIVFLHGWAQSSLAWSAQLADPELVERFRLIAVDLRGHGTSDVPAQGYDDSRAWANDLAAILEFAGTPAVVVGWSYGGLVIADYVREFGNAGLAGIALVGAITEIGRGDRPGGRVGPVMRDELPDVLSEDIDVALPALTRLCAGMASRPVPGPLAQSLLGASLSVPPAVRGALFRREVPAADALAAIDVPTLVLHGDSDRVIDPVAAEYNAGKISGARARWFTGVGHLPFIEVASEFNSVLRQFAEERLAR
ncbi:alpha/beta fold hydrolase [Amycolatopsis anabasis]|uniref:alpha/beta fold hydrolase n=1 Tax=Amycolatopsis anabasis TaxID=1840409 RepID=UPI00131B7A7C|nr:alpha/beta hydrolase [Amycolatopsis anabasis]